MAAASQPALVARAEPVPKFSLAADLSFPHHRSGWDYAIGSLRPLLKPGGILLDTFVDATFGWDLEDSRKRQLLPYRRPWVGFIHNPPGIPVWHEYSTAPQNLLTSAAWLQSAGACQGLYTLSHEMRRWLAQRVSVPVEALIHPTAQPDCQFDLPAYLAQAQPRIVQVGSWLRRLNSIALLPSRSLRKACLNPRPQDTAYLERLIAREQANDPAARCADWSSVEIIPYLDNAAFDRLFSRSLVFVDLYDTTVNNTVIECIVRNAPIVCNRLPAVVELLGADYPLFFDTLEEAAAKAENKALVERAALHLAAMPKDVFTGEHFALSLAQSAIYRSLPS